MQRSRNKTGPSKFPPNPKQWDAERNGLKIRSDFSRAAHVPLEPFDIAVCTKNVRLLGRDEFAQIVGGNNARILFELHPNKWSGFTVPVNGLNLIVLNSTHASTRQHATLMEELFHIRLGHKPCRVFQCPETGIMRREFDSKIEVEARHSAFASLVPFAALRDMLHSGGTIESIAEHFCVSIDVVNFRLNVTKLRRNGRV